MPALAPPDLFFDLAGRTVANSTTLEPLQVVCSWPLSGQYGVGSRILLVFLGWSSQYGRVVNPGLTTHRRYYVLVAACVLARKSEWLRNACLAAALILPAIAAIHAIVLAALHVDGMLPQCPFAAARYPAMLTRVQTRLTWTSMAPYNYAPSEF